MLKFILEENQMKQKKKEKKEKSEMNLQIETINSRALTMIFYVLNCSKTGNSFSNAKKYRKNRSL